MTDLSKKDINQIADRMVERMKATHHDFWIDPQTHYDDHVAMREVIGSWTSAKGIFAKAFVGLVVIGTLTMAAIALMGFDKRQ